MFRWLYALSYIFSIFIGIYVGFHLGNYTSSTLLNNLEANSNLKILNYFLQLLYRYWQDPQTSLIALCSYGSAGLLTKQLISNHNTFYYFLNLRQRDRFNQEKQGKHNLLTNNIFLDVIWGTLYILSQAVIPVMSFWFVGVSLFFKLFSLLWYFSIIPAWLAANFACTHSTNLINIIFAPRDLQRSLKEP